MVTKVPIRATVRRTSSLRRFGQGCDNRIGECIATLGGSRHVIDFRTLPFDHLSRQIGKTTAWSFWSDPGTGIARQALGDRNRSDLSVLNHNGRLDIAMAAATPTQVDSIFVSSLRGSYRLCGPVGWRIRGCW